MVGGSTGGGVGEGYGWGGKEQGVVVYIQLRQGYPAFLQPTNPFTIHDLAGQENCDILFRYDDIQSNQLQNVFLWQLNFV